MTTQNIQVGDKVRIGSEIGEVIKIDRYDKSTCFRVAFKEGPPKSFFSPPTEIEKISDPVSRLKSWDFDPPFKFDLLTRATQLSLAFEYNHLLSLSNSRTNLEPYQVECVYDVLNGFQQRFLIADDVGLGKTVEAGMILKELEARDRAKRVLIVTPAALTEQWQREMREKFDEYFWIYDSVKIKELKQSIPKDMNVWDYENRIITSIDYVKQNHILAALERAEWDLVIIDEAHKLSMIAYGDKIERTQRYRVGELLANKTENFLLLTATPHKGDRYAFWGIIRLLDPYIFKDADHIEPDKLNTIMIRRGKDKLLREDGSPVFKGRDVKSVPVEFNEQELELYRGVTNYVQEEYNLAKKLEKRAVGFAMVILQKRMVSSIAAIKSSLRRRLNNLKKGIYEEISERDQEIYEEFLKDPDRLNDYEKEKLERKLEAAVLDPAACKIEIERLEELIKLAENIERDSKARALKDFVDGILRKDTGEKILIFTEYRDTLDYLRDVVLKEYKYKKKILEIHGEVPVPVRKERERLFKESDANILLATDAAGEGINLQFCHIMVNYELPWNPNRIDQRIGRLHRYGQTRDVRARNLLIKNTREGQIFLRLQEKINLIERDLGATISEILGTLLEGVNLEKLIMDSLAEDKKIEVTEADIERAIEERSKMLEKTQSLLLRLHKFDLESALKLIRKSQRISFSNKDIESFVRGFFETHGGKIEPTRFKGQYRIIPPEDILIDKLIPRKIERATFEKDIAKRFPPEECDFIAFGHPLLDQIIKYCEDRDGHFGGGTTIKTIKNGKGRKNGVLFNYKMSFIDADGKLVLEDLIPIFIDSTRAINQEIGKEIPLEMKRKALPENDLSLVEDLTRKAEEFQQETLKCALQISDKRVAIVKDTMSKEVKIKLEDAHKYFKPRVKREEERILEFKKRLAKGEDMEIAIRGAESRKERLSEEYKNRIDYLKKKKLIYSQGPELLNCAYIIFK
ncbi:MAG: helicase-related protein [Candidatus Hodarchaeota archaeon]